MVDVPTWDTGIESENLKLKEEISMLKTENLKLANDLQTIEDILDEKNLLICDLKEENRGLADKVSRLESREADVPGKDVIPTLEAKIEKLVLENETG